MQKDQEVHQQNDTVLSKSLTFSRFFFYVKIIFHAVVGKDQIHLTSQNGFCKTEKLLGVE